MDSSETSTHSQLNSDFSHPLPDGVPLSAANASQPSERDSLEDSDAGSTSPTVRPSQHRVAPTSTRREPREPKHRIAQVREAQCVSLRTISRRSGVPVRDLRQQEHPHSDLRLSELIIWAEALEVPIVELLAEPEDSLCATIAQRAQMVRLMKTVEAMRAHAKAGSMRRIADAMRQQLLEIMPELADVTAWPKEGSRRPAGGLGRTATQPIQTERLESPSQDDSSG